MDATSVYIIITCTSCNECYERYPNSNRTIALHCPCNIYFVTDPPQSDELINELSARQCILGNQSVGKKLYIHTCCWTFRGLTLHTAYGEDVCFQNVATLSSSVMRMMQLLGCPYINPAFINLWQSCMDCRPSITTRQRLLLYSVHANATLVKVR